MCQVMPRIVWTKWFCNLKTSRWQTVRKKMGIILMVFPSLAMIIYYARFIETDQRRETRIFLAKLPANLPSLPTIDAVTCRCGRAPARYLNNFADTIYPPSEGALRSSTCGQDAAGRGPRQWVVSFSLYGTLSDKYGVGVRRNALQVALLYPGWVMRVYHSLDTGDDGQRRELCAIWCQFPHVDFCSVGKLPAEVNLPDLWKSNGMIWRFLVLGDPSVDRFIVRDLDSTVSKREAAAVLQWVASNLTWHFMHDNPMHYFPVHGGMWGGINRNLEQNTQIRDSLINDARGTDKTLLAKYLFQVAKRNNDFIDHNSYLCNRFGKSHPFPTRRLADNNFVGSVTWENTTFVSTTCPEECRPPEHLDWIYC